MSEEPVEEVRLVLMLLSQFLTIAASWSTVLAARLPSSTGGISRCVPWRRILGGRTPGN
jgi:hypothetical protein